MIRDWSRELLAASAVTHPQVSHLVTRADPKGHVSTSHRVLCSALSRLATLTYQALGGERHGEAVAVAGALLSLLTKIDDQVIDSLEFHGGWRQPREQVRAKTKAFLDLSWQSLKLGQAQSSDPRSHLAAQLGQMLRAFNGASPAYHRLMFWIETGWAIQVEAVTELSRHPREQSLGRVRRITASISGAWLMMISAVGTLPTDTARGFSLDEERGFFHWGHWIQLADALADFTKDGHDGLVSSMPLLLLSQRQAGVVEAVEQNQRRWLFDWLKEHAITAQCLPEKSVFKNLRHDFQELGQLPDLLTWIHGFLAWRYFQHPDCQELPDDERWSHLFHQRGDFQRYLRQVAASSQPQSVGV